MTTCGWADECVVKVGEAVLEWTTGTAVVELPGVACDDPDEALVGSTADDETRVSWVLLLVTLVGMLVVGTTLLMLTLVLLVVLAGTTVPVMVVDWLVELGRPVVGVVLPRGKLRVGKSPEEFEVDATDVAVDEDVDEPRIDSGEELDDTSPEELEPDAVEVVSESRGRIDERVGRSAVADASLELAELVTVLSESELVDAAVELPVATVLVELTGRRSPSRVSRAFPEEDVAFAAVDDVELVLLLEVAAVEMTPVGPMRIPWSDEEDDVGVA